MLKLIALIAKLVDSLMSIALLVLGTYFLFKAQYTTASLLLIAHSFYHVPTILFKIDNKLGVLLEQEELDEDDD